MDILYGIHCHSPGGNTAADVADRAFFIRYAHSPQGVNAAALAEFSGSECSC